MTPASWRMGRPRSLQDATARRRSHRALIALRCSPASVAASVCEEPAAQCATARTWATKPARFRVASSGVPAYETAL
eukprot:7627111-Lingulodinium_polyedra.AAC.1